jgi:crotonobetainyl-CoA:carnitine CoA-transferase CaiB-like acyl-CoA transferase
MTEPGTGPLAGVRVLDLTMNLSGPFATMILAQQGADVVKVERPPVGDILRKVGSGRGGTSAYFVNTNWGKRSIALDFEQEDDRATLRRLVGTADVLVENFRPTVMPRLGFVAEDLVAEHPRLIYAALRGFPSDSPLADAPAYDHVIQAMTGFGGNQADLRTGVPVLVQQAVVDKVTGLTAAQAITAALFERHRTGRGQVIEIPMLKAGLAFLWPDVSTNVTMQGEFDRLPAQSRTFRLSPTADGYVAMVTVTTPQWDGLLRAVGRHELVGDARYDTPQLRGRNAAALMKEIAATLATLPTDEVVRRLAAEGVPHAKVATLEELPAVIEEVSPGYLVREVHPQLGDMLHPAPPVEFDEAVDIRPAPAVGEHTAEILAELERD